MRFEMRLGINRAKSKSSKVIRSKYVCPSLQRSHQKRFAFRMNQKQQACNANASMTFKPVEEILPNEQTW